MKQLVVRNIDGAVVGGITCGCKGEVYIKGETAELEGLLKEIVDSTSASSNAKISELLCSNEGIECLDEIRHNLEGYGFKGMFANDDRKFSDYHGTEFNKIAFLYDFLIRLVAIPFGGEKRLREKIIEILNPQPADKVLDVCCGTGELTKRISEKISEMGEVIGIDLSPNMLSIARRKTTRVCFMHASSEDIPYPSNHFDKIIISFALHEMTGIARSNTLKEIHRVLRNDGKFMVIDYHRPKEFLNNIVLNIAMLIETKTARDIITHGIKDEIKSSGFRIEKGELIVMDLVEIILAGKITSS